MRGDEPRNKRLRTKETRRKNYKKRVLRIVIMVEAIKMLIENVSDVLNNESE